MCAVQMHNKKKILKSSKIENFKGLHTHVQTIALHMDSVTSYYPEYFESDVERSHENHPDEEMDKIVNCLMTTLREILMWKLDYGIFLH